LEIASSIEPVQDGRIQIEKINWPFLSELKGSIQRWPQARDRAQLALAARERHLCEVHGRWRQVVCLKSGLVQAEASLGHRRKNFSECAAAPRSIRLECR
jgi:hypothetical protein